MVTDENKSKTCIYCNALQKENRTICPTCEALASLMGLLQKESGERGQPVLSPARAPARLSQDIQRTCQSAPPPTLLPAWCREISLPSCAKSTTPDTAPSWPRVTLPMREKKSCTSWVQMYACQSSSWRIPTPSPMQPPQLTDKRDAAEFPTLPLLSLASSPLPSKTSRAQSPLPVQFPKSTRETAAPHTAVPQDVLLLSTLPHTVEHEILLLSTSTLSKVSRPSSTGIEELAGQPGDDTHPLRAASVPTGEQQESDQQHLHVPVMYTRPRSPIPTYRAISGLLSLLIIFAALSVGVVYDASASGTLSALQRFINNAPDPNTLATTVLPNWNGLDKGPAYDIIPFAQTASRIDPDLAIAMQPDKLFHVSQIFYATYSVQYPKTAGRVTIKWYGDNTLMQSLISPMLPRARISNGYAAILYTAPSIGAVELYWNDQLAQRLYFTVK